MKHIISRASALFLVLALMLPGTFVTATRAAENSNTSVARVINVVYDDSGSMIADKQGKGEYTDAWCKAQYSMEVFASMLGEEDVMNIFLMSKFTHFSGTYPDNPKYVTLKASERAKKVVTIKGSESVSQRVKDIQNLQCAAGNTPFATVKAAVYDFHDPDKGYASDAEQWLVILTDGAFDDVTDDIGGKIYDIKSSEYEIDGVTVDNSGLKIIFFGMQTNAELPTINTDESKGIYSYTGDTKAIRSTITNICSRIFNRNKLENVNVASGDFNFDVPLSELIVFEQAQDVAISGLTNPAGTAINAPASRTVTVKYTEEPYVADYTIKQRKEWYGSKTNNTWMIDRTLQGQIVTLSGDFQPGAYKVNATDKNPAGADKTLEIYYSPNVSIAVLLIPTEEDAAGIVYRVGETDSIPEGRYEVQLKLTNGKTGEILPDKTMLGDVNKYTGEDSIQLSAELINNGNNLGTFTNEKQNFVDIEKGDCSTSLASATFCDGVNTASAPDTSFKVSKRATYTSKEISYEVGETPAYSLEGNGMKGSEIPFTVKAKLDGQDLTEQQWAAWPELNIPKLTPSGDAPGISFKVERTDTPGVFNAYTSLDTSKISNEKYSTVPFDISANTIAAELAEVEYETWNGTGSGSVSITDRRQRLMSMSLADNTNYQLNTEGISNGDARNTIKITIDGETPTAEQWAGLNDISVTDLSKDNRVDVKWEKGEPGILYVYPTLDTDGDGEDEPVKGKDYENIDYRVTASGKNGLETYSGELQDMIRLTDARTWFEKNRERIKLCLYILFGLIILLGYIVKKRIPKKMASRPLIRISDPSMEQTDISPQKGALRKKFITQILPYVAERATLRVTPSPGVHQSPTITLKVKAASGGKVRYTNESNYAGRYDFGYNETPIAKGKTKDRSIGTQITYTAKGWKFTCYPNQKG